ncbi:WD repeat domain phosphoinositide-interacting protein 3 [Actinomortierella ambigua]|nr:WD repeat domain phosphoinositide-interacting protein 3 [Actinomortierella ambigua]
MNLSRSSPYAASDAPGLLYASFNQDFSCFSCGMDNGFRIFNCNPLKEKMRKVFDDGGISIAEMLFRCNYLALVGGGRNPKYPPNKVIIWDDERNKGVIELEFRSEVKAVKLRRDKFVVVLANKVIVYSFTMMPTKLHVFETVDNDRGLVALSSTDDQAILVFPGRQSGHIQIVDLNSVTPTTAVTGGLVNIPSDSSFAHRQSTSSLASSSSGNSGNSGSAHGNTGGGGGPSMPSSSSSSSTLSTAPPLPATTTTTITGATTITTPTTATYPMVASTTKPTANVSIIPAHTSPLYCLVTNADGTKCASASDKGTLIRVFDTTTSKLLNEFRRGVDRAEIYSIAFNSDSTRICAGSDKGTVHVFNLEGATGGGGVGGGGTGGAGSRVVYSQGGVPASVRGSGGGGPRYGEVQSLPSPQINSSGNRQSSLAFMKDLLPKYFSSAWSFAQFKVAADCRCICAFGSDNNTVIVICADGSFYRFMFDPIKGGEGVRESYHKFLTEDDDD